MISKKHLDFRITELEAKMMVLEDKLETILTPKKRATKNGKKVSS